MIDVYAAAGIFRDTQALARDLVAALMAIERVPDIPLFRQNTAAFVHELPAAGLANVDGDTVRVSTPRGRIKIPSLRRYLVGEPVRIAEDGPWIAYTLGMVLPPGRRPALAHVSENDCLMRQRLSG